MRAEKYFYKMRRSWLGLLLFHWYGSLKPYRHEQVVKNADLILTSFRFDGSLRERNRTRSDRYHAVHEALKIYKGGKSLSFFYILNLFPYSWILHFLLLLWMENVKIRISSRNVFNCFKNSTFTRIPNFTLDVGLGDRNVTHYIKN